MPMIVRSFVVLACCATLTGAGACGAQDCTLIGCANGVTVVVAALDAEPITVRMCAQAPFRLELTPAGSAVEVTVIVRDSAGRRVVQARGSGKVRLSYPNGRECGDECRNVSLRLEGARLVEADS